MAECSYARCLQERRLIKRELMKHSKDMLQIVGKWQQYFLWPIITNCLRCDKKLLSKYRISDKFL